MVESYISKPIEKLSLFKGTKIDQAIMVCGAGLINTLTKEQYDATIHIKIEEGNYFSQDFILEHYNNLTKLGYVMVWRLTLLDILSFKVIQVI